MMTSAEFVSKLIKIATECRTLYVSGGWGQIASPSNKTKAINQYAYNRGIAYKIRNAASDTYFFDCVCLLKSVLWGFNFQKNHPTGGAVYASNGVPDVGEGTMISMCKNVSTDFSKIKIGSAVWMPGHIGAYIGNGLAVECTPAWNDQVQITAVANIGSKQGYNSRRWTKHGELPWVIYTEDAVPAKSESNTSLMQYTDEQLAVMVIAGHFGNGVVRKNALGTRYVAVQNIVETMCREKTSETFNTGVKIHIVNKGENLTLIARQYGTTVDKIVSDNNIANRNLIHVGQKLVIK